MMAPAFPLLPINPTYPAGVRRDLEIASSSCWCPRVTTTMAQFAVISIWSRQFSKGTQVTSVDSEKCWSEANSSRSSMTLILHCSVERTDSRARATCPAPRMMTQGDPSGSIYTSNSPPQSKPVSATVAAVSRCFSLLGRPVAMTSIALRQISDSEQPPPTVPTVVPSSRINIRAPSLPGVDPVVEMIVARAALRPDSRILIDSLNTSNNVRTPFWGQKL